MYSRFAPFALLLVLLPACSPVPTRPEAAWTPPAAAVWELRGRVAVHAGEEGWHAGLAWRQTGEDFRIDLTGPFGQGGLRLFGRPGGVRLQRGDGESDRAADAETLLARNTGWELPVSGLRYWVRGLAVPGQAAVWERGPDGRPVRLQQNGWDIRYTEFREQAGFGPLPRRIDLARDGLNARLLIDAWTFG